MLEGNTDVQYSFASTLDSFTELFNGKVSISELLNMDQPTMRALAKARLENMKKRKTSEKDFEKFLKGFKP